MTRKEKALAIMNGGEYVIHPCNLLETAPQDETSIYYLQEKELDAMLPTTATTAERKTAMTEITLKDGRIFNSRFSDPETAIADVADYLFAEYDETLTADDIATIETF